MVKESPLHVWASIPALGLPAHRILLWKLESQAWQLGAALISSQRNQKVQSPTESEWVTFLVEDP